MRGEDELQSQAAQLLQLRGADMDHHPGGRFPGARGHQFLFALDLHQAQAAAGVGLDVLHGAEVRDVDAVVQGCPEEVLAWFGSYFLVVYC